MAVSGLVRDFSDCEKEKIKATIRALDDEKEGVLGSVGDAFNDLGLDFKDTLFKIGVQDYLDDIDSYHKRVMDKKNTCCDQIDSIFSEVYEVDSDYRSKFSILKDRLKELNNTFDQLNKVFDPSPLLSGKEIPLACTNFTIEGDINKLIDYYYNKLTNGSGNDKYNWEYINEIMGRNPKDVSEAELVALMKLVDSFGIVDGDGEVKVLIDTDSYANFIDCCFVDNKIFLTPNLGDDCKIKTYISPNLINLYSRYASYNHNLLREVDSNPTFYKNNDKRSNEIQKVLFNLDVMRSTIDADIIIKDGKGSKQLIEDYDEIYEVYPSKISLTKDETSDPTRNFDYTLRIEQVLSEYVKIENMFSSTRERTVNIKTFQGESDKYDFDTIEKLYSTNVYKNYR